MPKRIVNGFEMFYTDSGGEGFPLVLIMGHCAPLEFWPPKLLDLFNRDFRVIVFDNRGVGRSQAGSGPHRIKTLARDAAALMDALDIRRAHVFGISMGGMVAQELALRFPDRVEKLVLGCTHFGPLLSRNISFSAVWRWFQFLSVRSKTISRFLTHIFFGPGSLERQPEMSEAFLRIYWRAPPSRRTHLREMFAMLFFNSYFRLPRIQAPVLVLAGNRDFIIPWKNSRVLARRIPGARLHIFEGLGHGFIFEDIEATHHHIAGFLLLANA